MVLQVFNALRPLRFGPITQILHQHVKRAPGQIAVVSIQHIFKVVYDGALDQWTEGQVQHHNGYRHKKKKAEKNAFH
jgi:hypothetical protein